MGTNPSTKSEDMRMNPAGTLRSAGWALVLAWATAPLLAQDPLDAGPTEGLFSLPRSQDDIAEWQEARREIDERRYEAAVERLHRLLRNGSRGVVPRLGTRDRWTGIRTATIETLRDLPEAGRAAYERLERRAAPTTRHSPICPTRISPFWPGSSPPRHADCPRGSASGTWVSSTATASRPRPGSARHSMRCLRTTRVAKS
jgi:hypothetical protein